MAFPARKYSIQFSPNPIYAVLIAAIFLPGTLAAQTSSSGTLVISGDAVAGEKTFKKCKACHKLGENAKNSTGPVLNNIIGRTAGSFKGFKYGKAMKKVGEKGLVWSEKEIFDYILNPRKYLRNYLGEKKAKAKMKFKLKKEVERRNVIAFLKTFSKPVKSDEGDDNMKAGTFKSADQIPTHNAAKNQICIQNKFPKELLLTAESKNGQRQIKMLGQNGVLCVSASTNSSGTVGVFENEDALEGCSRLAKTGKTEVLIDYASFDNCRWSD